jgi:RNA recognition motif-containing protein
MWLTSKQEHDHILSQSSFYLKGRKFFVKPYLVGEELQQFKENIKKRRVFVHNIPSNVSNTNLGTIMEIFGPVEDSYLIYDQHLPFNKKNFKSKRFGYVIFEKEADAQMAIISSKVIYGDKKLLILPF